MPSNRVQLGLEAVGGKAPRTGRTVDIQAKDFTSVEQAVPLRLVYGQAKVSGVQITPIFSFRSEAQVSDSGGGK